jgi:hypothetical protein
MDRELELKKLIIKTLKKEKCWHLISNDKNEQYIRGFIYGASTVSKIIIPCHWYEEIIEAVLK